MDIEKYIASGILEEYALNSASPQERQEVECMSHIYPEIKEALVQLEQSIENFVFSQSIEPPKELKGKILEKIKTTTQEGVEEGRIIQLDQNIVQTKNSRSNIAKLSIAASILFLVGMLATWYHYNGKANQFESDYLAANNKVEKLNVENNSLASTVDSLNSSLSTNQNLLAELSNFNTRKIELAGTEISPSSKVNVFWNSASENVFVKVDDLPEVPSQKQYQLWAIVDGQPTDMGVFDLASASTIQEMPYKVTGAQAFAITLENEGGSEVPTLSELYVIGNV